MDERGLLIVMKSLLDPKKPQVFNSMALADSRMIAFDRDSMLDRAKALSDLHKSRLSLPELP